MQEQVLGWSIFIFAKLGINMIKESIGLAFGLVDGSFLEVRVLGIVVDSLVV